VLGLEKQDKNKFEDCVKQGVNTTPMNLKYCPKDKEEKGGKKRKNLCVPKPNCALKGLSKQKRSQCKLDKKKNRRKKR